MSILSDTLHAISTRYPEALEAWLVLCVLPLISCTIWVARYFSQLDRPVRSFRQALAYSYGYPTAMLGLIVVPLSAFTIFLAPALLEGYPSWRLALLTFLEIPNWFAAQAFWLAPSAWLLWVILAPWHAIRNGKSEVK